MKICFYQQPFDIDVSSGTDHARHQWHELACAFGVTHMAVINETDQAFAPINERVHVTEYADIASFLVGKSCVFVEQGSYVNHRSIQIPRDLFAR